MSESSHVAHHTQDSYEDKLLTPFFGPNIVREKTPEALAEAALHPCVRLSRDVHRCLEENNNRGNFCVSKITKVEHCLRDYKF